LRSTRKPSQRQAPAWLSEAVYEPKRQRTAQRVKQAVDALVEQRKHDGVTRISLTTIVVTAKQQDPAGRGIAHTSILENDEAYAYYKKFRTANKPKKRERAPRNGDAGPVIKAEQDQSRVRQRYLKMNREELVDQLLLIEQQYARLHEHWLSVNDNVLEWQVRAEQAEAQLQAQQKVATRKRESK
jgi:hypothetical protein